jgi:predicted  nucleic acid-binding Zn-ribbon protein
MVLFTAITFSSISIKAFNTYQRQSERYQDLYITALSLREEMSSFPQFKKLAYKGVLNEINYEINIKKLIEKRNYIIGQDGIGRYDGDYLIGLYQLKMNLIKGRRLKEYIFLLTKQKRIK